LTALAHLNLTGTQATDLTPIAGLTGLRVEQGIQQET
jgi:hypothetical protein